MILVDTSVWSLALRRRRKARLSSAEIAIVNEWKRKSRNSETALIGIVRQEVLSGIRDQAQFQLLKNALDTFPHLTTSVADHDRAAECFNLCRSAGITGDPVDMLVCACAIRHDVAIFSVDPDYERYSRRLPIRLHIL